MTTIVLIGFAMAQAAPIGSALRDGSELVYESGGAAQAPWVYESVGVVERHGFDRCVLTRRRSQPARESCVRADTLFERTDSNTHRPVRPLGPDMRLDVRTPAGDVLQYTTHDVRTERVVEGLEVAVLSTTIVTRNASGAVTRRLRERYAPALLTAVWGVFETPDGSGGWTVVREFSLVEVRAPAAVQPDRALVVEDRGSAEPRMAAASCPTCRSPMRAAPRVRATRRLRALSMARGAGE